MLEETLYPYRKLYVIFRTYNEGIAFRYEIPYQSGFEKVVIDKELTEFAFPKTLRYGSLMGMKANIIKYILLK